MIKEYIDKLLEENNQDLKKLEKQMKSLLEELSCAEEWSESLQIQSNSQRNIFSPRNIDTEIGKKIEKATISIQEIKKEIEYVRDLIETHLKKREEYLKMLGEIENSSRRTEHVKQEDNSNIEEKCGESSSDISIADLKKDEKISVEIQKESSTIKAVEYEKKNGTTDKNVLDFLSDIYSKTELCLALLNSDKNRCKKELNGIKTKIKKYAEEIENK